MLCFQQQKDSQERSLLPTQTLGDLLGHQEPGNFPPLWWGEGVQAIEREAGFGNHPSPAVVGQLPLCIAGPTHLAGLGRI